MKTLKTILASAVFTSVALTGITQAAPISDNDLYDIIHPESADIFNVGAQRNSAPTEIVSLNDNNNDSVWSVEFEEYVNSSSFKQAEIIDINELISSNPTAAGGTGHKVFIYNELAGDYQLQ